MKNTKLQRFLIEHVWPVVGLVLSVATVVTLTFTHLADAIYFEDSRHQNIELRSWMTPRYIALSYDLPRPLVLELLEIEAGSTYSKRLDLLAERLGITMDELTNMVRETAVTYRETNSD